MTILLHTDGGSRGNPGPAGIGFVVSTRDGNILYEYGEAIGDATNNHAEYRALIAGLQYCAQQNYNTVACFLDSELVVKQMNGEYRVKHPDIIPLHLAVKKLIPSFTSITFTAVRREKNKQADALVNKALDGLMKN